MPQSNFYTYLSQCTWTIIIFFIFYAIMKQLILPAILESLKVKNLFTTITTYPTTTLDVNLKPSIKDKYFSILPSSSTLSNTTSK